MVYHLPPSIICSFQQAGVRALCLHTLSPFQSPRLQAFAPGTPATAESNALPCFPMSPPEQDFLGGGEDFSNPLPAT